MPMTSPVDFISGPSSESIPLPEGVRNRLNGSTASLTAIGACAGGTPGAHAPLAVKEAVLPFKRFRTPAGKGVDSLLGPEMKSTGEVMGFDRVFGTAFAKSQAAAYGLLPTKGTVFVSIANRDKRSMIFPIKRLADLGFTIVTTAGTGEVLRRHGIACEVVPKHYEGPGQNAVELILAGEIAMIINTPQGSGASAREDGYEIRSAAVTADIPSITTTQGAAAAVMGIEALMRGDMTVRPLQELHAALRGAE